MDYSSSENIISNLITGATTLFFVIMFIILIFLIVVCVANWKMFRKAGKKGWECLVPFYGNWVLIEIAGLEWWWFLLIISDTIVSLLGIDKLSLNTNLVSFFAGFNIYYNIAKKFGKDNGTAVCAGIFYNIFVLIFGFSNKEVYDKNIPVNKNGIFK